MLKLDRRAIALSLTLLALSSPSAHDHAVAVRRILNRIE